MKIVFLDIDGVVVSDKTNNVAICKWYGTKTLSEAMKMQSKRKSDGLYVPKFMGTNSTFDPIAVGYMNALAKNGVQFVITSTWRESQTVASLQVIFEMKGLHIPIFAFTSIDSNDRGVQILNWLKKPEAKSVTKWCVVDDYVSDILPHIDSELVQTDPDVGFDETAYNMVNELLEL